jgi:hypothetical protein
LKHLLSPKDSKWTEGIQKWGAEENSLLQKEEVERGWRKANKVDLHGLSFSSDVIKLIKSGACATHEGKEKWLHDFDYKT